MKKLLLNILVMSVLVMTTFGMASAAEGTCGDGYCDCSAGETPENCQSDCGDELCDIIPYCGDGRINPEFEECDDGNDINNDACSNICTINPCEVIVDEPIEGNFYDPVTIRWHYEGDCDPFEYELKYQEETCDGDVWEPIAQDRTPDVGNNNVYEWPDNLLPESGVYCIAVNMDQENAEDVTGHSGIWYLDLVAPEADYTIWDGPNVLCEQGEDCDYYITQDTEIKLTCDEIDNEPWQSGGPYTKYYRYRVYDEISQMWGAWSAPEDSFDEYTGPFSFPEDSRHELEYYCTDRVLKESDVESAILIVNTEAPTLSKTVDEPKVQGCEPHPGQVECDWFLTQDTEICLFAEKGNSPEHPTPGELTFSCYATVWETLHSNPTRVIVSLDENNCFTYGEDSYHELHCTATDALGNTGDLYEADIVDSAAPETELTYEGPYYHEDEVQWIDTDSRVVLTATDPEPHPVGLKETKYRYGILPDIYCSEKGAYSEEDVDWETEGWIEYSEPFEIPESCHVIEYYSTDRLGNSEDVNVEFVFSDHTAPALDISVGESGEDCNSQNVDCEDGWDWIVTMGTPITLSCEDQMPHPSGVQKICYKIFWDGDTEQPTEVCENTNEITIWFRETCEHRVEYTCYDNVEKHSSDSRTFKVIGEDFEIELDKKWNLISVPVNLLSSNVEEVFGGDENIEEVWSYEDGEWFYYIPGDEDSTLMDIVPGRGYWVKTSNPTMLIVGGSLFEAGSVTPNSVPIDSGWNLIGHYGMASKPRICALASIFNEWSTLIGYNSGSTVFYDVFWMNPGEGYWFFAQGDDSYAYSNKGCFGPYLP